MVVYLRDGSAETVVRAATLRQKLQIGFAVSHSHRILTLGQPVLAPGKVCFFGRLTSQQHASVSQGRICTDNFTCCHTELQIIKPSTSPSHSILKPGRPVTALTLQCQAPDRVATGVPVLKSLV